MPVATLGGEALPNVMRKVIAHGLGLWNRQAGTNPAGRIAADTMLAAGLAPGRSHKEAPMIATGSTISPRRHPPKLLGWHLLDARPKQGWVRIGFDGKAEFCNPAGFIQGGILTAMLDDTMGPAVFVMTEGRLYTATITITVNFLAPAKPGPIVGEADVMQLGKTVAFVAEG